MHNKFLVSSFSKDILEAAENTRNRFEGVYPKFDIIYLYNDDNVPLPSPDVYTAFGDGVNISANHITQEVVNICKQKGLKVGVWIRKIDFTEDDSFYNKMYEMGVDFIVSDFPLRAMEVRQTYFSAEA